MVSKLLRAAVWSACAVELESEHTLSFQVVYLDLLLCSGVNSERAVLFLFLIFTLRPRMNARLSEAMSTVLVCKNFWWNPSKFLFPWKLNSVVTAKKITFLNIARAVALFLKLAGCGPQRPLPTRKRPLFVLAHPTRLCSARVLAKRAWPSILTLNCLLE